MKFIVTAGAILAAALIGATVINVDDKKSDAVRILEDTHKVKVTSISYSFFGCSEDDNFSFKWEGFNEDGKRVKGNACSGFLKGTTIRFK